MSRFSSRSLLFLLPFLVVTLSCSPESPLAPEVEEVGPDEAPQAKAPKAIDDEYIVIFRDDRQIPPGLARRLAGDHGLSVKHEYRHAVNGFAAKIPPQALNGLRNNPFIDRIEPNLEYELTTPAASSVTVPSNGLRVRLVADDLSPGDVAVWPNQGSEGDAVQPSASRRPSLQTADPAFAGHASVGFNLGRDNDEVLEIQGVSAHGSATVVAVFRQQDANRHNYGLATMYGAKNSRASAVTRHKSGGAISYWDSDGGWIDGSSVLSAGTAYVAVWRIDASGLVDMQVDGAPAGSFPADGPIPSFDRYLFGMTLPSTNSRFDGWVAELMVYDRPLDDCERDGIVSDLGTWYGVSLAPGFGPCGGTSPADPTNLVASPAGTEAIDAVWTDASADELGFRVERRLGQLGAWSEAGTVASDETAFMDSGLTPDTEYCYRVFAFNGSGESGASNTSCAFTDAPPPPPDPIVVPTAGLRVRLIANDLGTGDVASWPNRGSEGDALQSDAARRPSFLPPGPDFGGQAAVAFNEGSDNDEALEISGVSSHGSGTLVAVFREEDAGSHNYGLFGPWGSSGSRLAMVTSASSSGNDLVYWDSNNGWSGGAVAPAPGVTYVGVWRFDENGTADLFVDGQPAGSAALGSVPSFSRYVVGMSEPSTSSRFDGWVAELLFYDRALLDCELGPLVTDLGSRYGVTVTSGGAGPCVPPADPTGLSATAAGYDAVDLGWSDNSANEDGFRIERRLGQAGTWSDVGMAGTDEVTFMDSDLSPDTEYCYRVIAFNGSGDSDASNVSCAFTDALPALPDPIEVSEVGLRVRLIANDLGAGDVASWPNRGSEADAIQSDAARRPSFQSPGPNFGGQAAVAFNEGNDDDEALEISGVATHGSGTLVAVFREEDAGAHNYGIFGPWGSGASRVGMVTSASSSGNDLVYWDSNNGWSGGSVQPAPGVTYIGAWRFQENGSADLFVDGQPAGSAAIGSVPSFDRYVVGMTEPSTTSRFDGWVGELLFYDRALLDCELDPLVEDLGERYGVAVTTGGAGPCIPPADPTGVSATAAGYNAIDLAWSDNSANEDGFRVEQRLGQAGAWSVIATTGPDATTYTSSSLIQQTEYCYRVAAFNDDGPSAFTSVECATTEEAPPGACVDSGGHDDLSQLYGIQAIGAPANQTWASTQVAGCEIQPWYFGLDSGVDSDHPDLNVIEASSFVAAEPGHDGEDRNGHGTHTAGSAAARDGNGGVVGVAPGAPIFSFRVCEDGGSCQTADMVAAMDSVIAAKLANPNQPMVANMSIGGPADAVIDEALRNSINAGIVYAVAAGNGILGACIFPANAANVSPARVGDDEILPGGGSAGNNALLNGVLTTTSHNSSFNDVNCNYGAPVSVAAPGYQIKSTWLNGGYNTISGTSMATPHAAGAALLYLQNNPAATPAEVEDAIVQLLLPWTTNDQPNASGRLNVDGL